MERNDASSYYFITISNKICCFNFPIFKMASFFVLSWTEVSSSAPTGDHNDLNNAVRGCRPFYTRRQASNLPSRKARKRNASSWISIPIFSGSKEKVFEKAFHFIFIKYMEMEKNNFSWFEGKKWEKISFISCFVCAHTSTFWERTKKFERIAFQTCFPWADLADSSLYSKNLSLFFQLKNLFLIRKFWYICLQIPFFDI